MISVVVPTCNRPNELVELLDCLLRQDIQIDEIIIVDSSDHDIGMEMEHTEKLPLKHIKVHVKSAAVQRNVGMDEVSKDCTYLCFLDDDVKPDANYLSNLINGLTLKRGVGISGIAINPAKSDTFREPPRGLFGRIQRFFFLDSLHDGKLLKSGVNIPVRKYSGPLTNVEWLIGCSVWDYKKIMCLRFEPDFLGSSLCEDVIFSVRASRHGEILVDPETHLCHSESEIGRQKGVKFWEMWVINRRRVVEISSRNNANYFYFHIANLGQFLALLYSGIRNRKLTEGAHLGIIFAYKQILLSRFKHGD
jgi:glycosyltransferase involved in cell wall biosynthesis